LEHVFTNKDGLQRNDFSPKSNGQVQQQSNLGQTVQLAALSPGALSAGNIAQLQRTLGNRAVTQLLSNNTIQRAPEDDDELQFKTAQRAKSPEEEEPLQGKFQTVQRAPEDDDDIQFKTAQRAKSPEEEEPLQGKFATIQRAAEEEEEVQT